MINHVVLIGRLTKDPELKATNSGTNYCQFTLAVDSGYKDENGESRTDFINCVAWKNSADNLVKYQRKGSLIALEGRVQVRSYETENGTRWVTEVVASNIRFLESKKEESRVSNDSVHGQTRITKEEEDLPF